MEVNSCQNSSLKRVDPWKGVSNSYPKMKVSVQHTEKADDLRKSSGSLYELNHNP